jgi:glycosyltransferase involved in cell wall biosynthesis
LDAGGAERTLTQLVLGLPRDEWEPRVYALGGWGPFATVLQDQGVPVVCLNAWHWWDAPGVVWRLRREWRSFRPALVQTFLFHANILGRLAARSAGVPHILSGQRVAERRSRIYGWIDRWTNGLVDRNVCVSRGVADYLEREIGCPPAKTVVIPNGVDPARFVTAAPCDWTRLGLPPESVVLLGIGRLEPQKGFDDLLAALPPVLSTFAPVQVVIVGDGPDRGRLEQQTAELGLAERVRFVGRRTDVPSLLAGCYGLVLPSRWEGMPNVVLEAMAAGKPVVATQVEGVAELVQDGVTGWLSPPRDPEGLTRGLSLLLQDPERATAMGRESQHHVEKQFTSSQMVARYAALYREVLLGSVPPPVCAGLGKNSGNSES